MGCSFHVSSDDEAAAREWSVCERCGWYRGALEPPACARELAQLPIELGPLTAHDAEALTGSMVAHLTACGALHWHST